MKFKQWLEATPNTWLQAPTTGQMVKTGLGAVGQMAADLIPGMGTVSNLSQAAMQLLQMRKQRRDVVPMLLKMMHQQDQGGAPADAFDLEDNIATMLSDPSKKAIAQEIVKELDRINAQQQGGQIPPDMANRQAVRYIQQVMGPTANRLGSL